MVIATKCIDKMANSIAEMAADSREDMQSDSYHGKELQRSSSAQYTTMARGESATSTYPN
jgi:hypothetical protein